MRLKTTPDDFRVRELLEWNEVPNGNFIVHKLHKEKLSTPEALTMLARDAGVERSAIAYAGLKDRQAVTDQFITIERRAVELKLANLKVTPVGATDRPITSKQSTGNAFIGHRKSVTAKGKLFENGKQIGSFLANRVSGGGAFGGYKSSCAIIHACGRAVGKDIAGWLASPAEGARLGDLK